MKPAFQNYAERGYLYFLAVVEYGSRARPTEGFASGYSSSVGVIPIGLCVNKVPVQYGKTRLEGSSIPKCRVSVEYVLRFIQQPRFGAVTLPDAHGNYLGLPVAPAPVIEVRRFVNGSPVALEVADARRLLLFPHLIKLGDNGEPNTERPSLGLGFDPPKEAIRDVPPESGEGRWLFVFDDIGVIEIGRYHLHFTLHDPPPPLNQIGSDEFEVVASGDWPLDQEYYTDLSARLNREHGHINIYGGPR
ncbi:hypothetical protein MJO28_002817 [Puccinia striiformis f. sp. tritici]|uniref:Uncharacterized protein n=1 Tax=Puccinia striiformis f. sp. tritici TaxID=168172 RepID=A0ACC0ET12_9BASI|nr:hypothetical protein MJO28_002817 [Puccinia striiformis f. sp. tritici]